MEELTYTKISPYLPYHLEFLYDGEVNDLDGIYNNNDVFNAHTGEMPVDLIKPLLRPLSDLIKETYWKDLLRLLQNRGLYESRYGEGFDNYKARIVQKPFGKIFKLQNQDDWVCIISLSEPDRCKAVIYNWLLANHFDVFNLLGKGLAENINKL